MNRMIWLASYPRSGNTFFRNVLYDVYGIPSGHFHDTLKEGTSRPDYSSYQVVKTHMLPEQLVPVSREIPAVYIIRDGRDCMVSMAHQKANILAPGSNFNANMREAIIAARGSFFWGWSQHVEKWLKRTPVIIRFEELIKYPLENIEKIKQFIALPDGDHGKLPTFESQKYGDPKYGGKRRKFNSKKPHVSANFTQLFFNRGKVGYWQEEMPVDLQQLFWKLHGETMLKVGYTKEGNTYSR